MKFNRKRCCNEKGMKKPKLLWNEKYFLFILKNMLHLLYYDPKLSVNSENYLNQVKSNTDSIVKVVSLFCQLNLKKNSIGISFL